MDGAVSFSINYRQATHIVRQLFHSTKYQHSATATLHLTL